LHPVTNPAVSRSGMIYATISGQRGKQTPVSIVRVSPDGRGTPFVTGILNATGLAFNPDGDLFVTSRAEGNVYRIDEAGEPPSTPRAWAWPPELAFDAAGNLFVGDRSGTIFKIDPEPPDLRLRHAGAQRRGLSPGRRRRRHALRHRPHALLQRRHLGHRHRTATPAPGSAAWAVRRAWRSPRRATSTWPPASVASAAWCASRRKAKPAWCSPAPT
jgi:hypothetical protein